MLLDLYDFYVGAKEKNIMFYYCGPIAHTSIEGVAQTLRRNLEYEDAGNMISQSVFSIFIEQMQNILNYSADKIAKDQIEDDELRAGVIVIGHENDGYFIICGNKVFNRDVQELTERIEPICHMNKEELKVLYKERRRMEPDPGSKGAGLGFIEMARKSSVPLEYSFKSIDECSSFFSIKAVVGR